VKVFLTNYSAFVLVRLTVFSTLVWGCLVQQSYYKLCCSFFIGMWRCIFLLRGCQARQWDLSINIVAL